MKVPEPAARRLCQPESDRPPPPSIDSNTAEHRFMNRLAASPAAETPVTSRCANARADITDGPFIIPERPVSRKNVPVPRFFAMLYRMVTRRRGIVKKRYSEETAPEETAAEETAAGETAAEKSAAIRKRWTAKCLVVPPANRYTYTLGSDYKPADSPQAMKRDRAGITQCGRVPSKFQHNTLSTTQFSTTHSAQHIQCNTTGSGGSFQ